jgi:hypothetical protein
MNEPKETDCNWQSIEYTPVSRDRETAEQLLSQDKTINVFQGNRFKRRRWNVVTTALLILNLTTVLGGFVFLVATGAMASLIDRLESSDTAMSSFSNANLEHTKVSQCAPEEVVLHEHSFEGLVRPSDKDLSGTEFLMKDPCGRSPAEARARGCRFGMLYYSWLPEECYDEQIEEEWKAFNGWKYWLYPNRTGEVSWDEAATGEYDVLLVDWESKSSNSKLLRQRVATAPTFILSYAEANHSRSPTSLC